ncbi:engulfment and cell motility domain 2, putative [Trypanosoma equiperdum]|uniref:ELMO domain-containing protein n=2 Tax=Trypanozoon TaxID=39700 RepID=Q38FQ3_TRYB2|nr:hypothetical protein, conserved [Trypanosoma brucei brucei TREU927]EAN76367.1 hypothetical protein, conserved [Trypanosoma brucei brucei TREU927]SCU66992.1 engulfment and cell motility domain 2, putative [Trypanosoma equiperdum]
MGSSMSCLEVGSDSRCFGLPTPVMAALVAGAGGLLFLLYKVYRCQTRKVCRRTPVLQSVNIAVNQPELAVKKAAEHIMKGEITTVGQLVFFFRGGEEKAIRINRKLFECLQEAFPVGTADQPPADGANGAEEHVCHMMQQLCRCEEQAARLEAERATAFDDGNPQHIALLERLWVAAGKPKSAFARRSSEWNDLGFQGMDPVTDLRGGGVLALRQFLHFAEAYNDHLKGMMEFNKRALADKKNHWYLLAVVSIQFTAQLLLQRDYKVFLPQLEVLYDTISRGHKPGILTGSLRSAAAMSEVGTQSIGALSQNSVDCSEGEETSDFEVGYFALHHQLLLSFKECWHRDLPHVMEYNKYLSKFLESFFSPE